MSVVSKEEKSSKNHGKTVETTATTDESPTATSEVTTSDLSSPSPSSYLGIIFLDIDGVLLPFPKKDNGSGQSTKRLFPDGPLRALSKLLEETPHSKIVLSSTWRVREDFRNDILDCFQDFANEELQQSSLTEHDNSSSSGGGGGGSSLCPLGQIANDGFWGITDPEMHSERQWEIHDWLSKQEKQMRQNQHVGGQPNSKKQKVVAEEAEVIVL